MRKGVRAGIKAIEKNEVEKETKLDSKFDKLENSVGEKFDRANKDQFRIGMKFLIASLIGGAIISIVLSMIDWPSLWPRE